jgi:hypothetical protein
MIVLAYVIGLLAAAGLTLSDVQIVTAEPPPGYTRAQCLRVQKGTCTPANAR